MKFSVLIPVYNTEKYLGECMESVLGQSFGDFEVILVDDGSTDGSPALCDGYAEQYPEKVRVIHQENRGLISARRVGIAQAAGEYCLFLDSDDRFEENALDTVYIELTASYYPDVLLYSFSYLTGDPPFRKFRQAAPEGSVWSSEEAKKALYEKLLFSDDVTAIWTKAVKTELLRSDPTDYTQYLHKNMAEDLLQSLYIITAAQRVKYVYRSLVLYRYNTESISHNFNPDTIEKKNTLHVYKKIREYLPLWGMDDPDTIKRIDARWFNDVMHIFFKSMEQAGSREDTKAILTANWNSMIPNRDVDTFAELVNQEHLKVYRLFSNDDFRMIRRHFALKKRIRQLRNLKKRTIG